MFTLSAFVGRKISLFAFVGLNAVLMQEKKKKRGGVRACLSRHLPLLYAPGLGRQHRDTSVSMGCGQNQDISSLLGCQTALERSQKDPLVWVLWRTAEVWGLPHEKILSGSSQEKLRAKSGSSFGACMSS